MNPEQILHYKIERKIGQGGMGEVFLATDTKLGREVALKFLPSSLSADPEARERLLREAQAASKLIHPNIVTVHSIETSDDRDFIVMEYVPGKMLGEYFGGNDRSLDEVLSISLQLAEALQKAHEAGVIHRDLKPGNILMDADGRPRILDFGLAKIEGAAKLTQDGSTMGTMAYISPEQAEGKEVDPRSDIFSFGVLLYEMISGRLPFAGEHEAALVYSIVHDEPEPMARYKTGVADELQHVVTKCLAKDAGERYQTVGDLAADLKRQVRMSQAPRPATPLTDTQAKTQAKSMLRWVIPAALLMLGIWYFAPQGDYPNSGSATSGPVKLAVLPFENLGAAEDEYFADGITEEIIARLASVSGLGVIARTSIMQYKGTEKQIQVIAEELGVDYILEGTIRWQKSKDAQSKVRITPQLVKATDGTHAWAHIYEESIEEVFQVQSDVAEQVVAALNITLLEPERERLVTHGTENLEAYDYYLKGTVQYNLIRGGVNHRALNLASQLFSSALRLDSEFAAAHARLAQCHIELYWHNTFDTTDLTLALEHLDRALKLDPNGAEPLMARGSYYYHDHQYEAALRELERASEIQPGNTVILAEQAYIYRRQGDFELALDVLQRSIDLDPHSQALIQAASATAMYIREYDTAEKLCRRAIRMEPSLPRAHADLAGIRILRDGDLSGAQKVFEEGSAIVTTFNDFYSDWANVEYLLRQFESAMAKLAVDRGDEPVFPFHLTFAQYSLAAGDTAQARIHFDSARTDAEASLATQPNPYTGFSALGVAYAGLGEREKAIEFASKAVNEVNNEMDRWITVVRSARAYTLLSEQDSAIDALTTLLTLPGPISKHSLRLNPAWDPLREHPRFKALVAGDSAT